jgi:lipid II:glycine glycyltransferase (peptidoglycan interpeptide bridge formation enzyme)
VNPPAESSAAYTVREAGGSPFEWDEIVASSPGGGHVFQSHAWGEMKRSLGWEPLRLVFERGGEVIGAAQFLLYGILPLPGRLAFCPKGPWLPWDDEEAVRAFFEDAKGVARERNIHTLKVEPEVEEADERTKALLGEIGFEKFRWDLNHKTAYFVDLNPTEDEILANMKRGTRYNARLAARKDVQVVEDNSLEAQEEFWEMFEVTAKRNGFWYRPREYQFQVWKAMFGAERAQLFFAEHEGERLAGAMAYVFGGKCWYFQSATTNEKRNLKPTHLLQREMMLWAKRNGATRYDMMAVPGPEDLENEDHPLHGVYEFKKGFGGEVKDFVGCLDLPVNATQAKLWKKTEPVYYRAYRKLKKDIYY